MTKAATTAEIRLHGIGVSPGIARGPVCLSNEVGEHPQRESMPATEVEAEMALFHSALEKTRRQLERMRMEFAEKAGTEEAAIFDVHILMLEDRVFLDESRELIRQTPERAAGAFATVAARYANSMRRINDDYLRERAVDIEDVARRVIRNLLGLEQEMVEREPHILLAHELTPSFAATMDRSIVLGVATEAGSYTSHAAIIARSMGLPAVVGLHAICDSIHVGQDLLLDGYEGLVILNPSEETLAEYEQTKRQKSALTKHLAEMREAPAITCDGIPIVLSANIEFETEMDAVLQCGAQGVGLYRTEFFYLNRRTLPSEDEQAANYSRVAAKAGPQGAIIRTLDIGGDKLHAINRDIAESNPFLGWRGIRVSLSERHLFKTQLRAILRASAHGRLRVMFPMISCLAEIREARTVLNDCRDELTAEGIAFDPNLEVGAMIEIPSAALTADSLAREVDFFSVGTNDLIQYTLAVDRGNERVADLYQPCHPAIVRLLKSVADSARNRGIWAGVCGEMAGDIWLTPLLVGLGFAELSVASVQLPSIKYAIRKLPAAACATMVSELLDLDDSERIYSRVKEMALEYYPELLG